MGWIAGWLALGLGALPARGAALTMEQAIELSERTGRPIFAVAGNRGCVYCRALLDRLNTDRAIQPLDTLK
jgi:hypothetical protein